MKNILLVAGLLLGLLAPQLRADDPPKKPGPEQKKLEAFTGKWKGDTFTVETPFGPADKATSEQEGRLVHGGFQIETRGKGRSSQGSYSWTEVNYYDPNKHSYGSFYYSSDGVAGVAAASVNGNTWTFTWEQPTPGKNYKCRSVVVFAPDGKSHTFEGTYSEDGVTWKPWMNGKLKKVGKVK